MHKGPTTGSIMAGAINVNKRKSPLSTSKQRKAVAGAVVGPVEEEELEEENNSSAFGGGIDAAKVGQALGLIRTTIR